MSKPKAADHGELVAPRLALWGALRDATLEVFSTMVGTAIVVPQLGDGAANILELADSKVRTYATGMIGIAGAMRAILSMRCSESTATKIAAQMLGVSSEEAVGQNAAAIGEICNMVAGRFKQKIGFGDGCTLSVPTVVAGGKYSIHCLEAGHGLELPATYDGETVLVTLDIRDSDAPDPSSLRRARP
jgi:CheY-specific phosphatase CheX